jgi:protein-glutamine gamma-glutamyltransferase
VQLATWFQISMAAQVAWSGLLLAIAEGRPSPQMISPVLAIAGLVLTDRRGTFRLTPGWATGAAFFGFCMALAELFAGGIEARLLWGAHLLVYLTWVLVFLPKTTLLNWLLCALCLLQVAVGAVLMTRSGIYGGLVVLYFFLAVWTLSVFSLHQARERLEPAAAGIGAARREVWARERRGGARLALAFAEAGPAGLLPAAERLRAASQVHGAIQLDPHERWLRLRFVTGPFVAASASLGVGLVFFVLTPRVWIGSGPPRDDEPLAPAAFAVTGFSDNVQLGDFGEILTSAEPVFEVRLSDADTGAPLDVLRHAWQAGMDEPLFRGAVMSRYVPNSGRWESASNRNSIRIDGRRRSGMVRQEISLEPIDTDVLFAMHPARACRIHAGRRPLVAYQDPRTARLFSSREHTRPVTYSVYSPRQWAGDEGDLADGGVSQPTYRDQALPADLPQLVALARRVAGYRDDGTTPGAAEMARRLLVYLRDSQQFVYSLDMTRADQSSDPIEDFLFRRRAGHCEYFASALALLLRSVDIPARLVNGFKGGEPRDDGSFEVQRRHAHAWVEAFYDGRWHVLDPTPPAARSASVEQMASSVRSFDDLLDVMSRSWAKYVVAMDLNTQRRDFYEPLRDSIQQLWDSLQGDRQTAASLMASARDFLSSPRRWFSWQGGLVTFVLLLVLCGCWWVARRVWRGVRYLWTQVRTAAIDRGRQVEFYEHFRRVCERQGLVRPPGQTQREYAGDVSRRLEPLLAGAGLGGFPAQLVELFYRVRFGEEPLDRQSALEIERRLGALEEALGANGAARDKLKR